MRDGVIQFLQRAGFSPSLKEVYGKNSRWGILKRTRVCAVACFEIITTGRVFTICPGGLRVKLQVGIENEFAGHTEEQVGRTLRLGVKLEGKMGGA